VVQGLFAHGIDVLRKTDFYSISIRRNAFLTAAPQVAERVDLFFFDRVHGSDSQKQARRISDSSC